MAVLQVIHVDPALPPRWRSRHGGDLRKLADDDPGQEFGHRPRLIVGALPAERQQHVKPRRSACLDETGHPDFVAQRADRERDLDHVRKRCPLGVEIEDAPVGMRQTRSTRRPKVQRDRPEVGEVQQALLVLANEVPDFFLGALTPDGLGAKPLRGPLRRILLIEVLALDPVGVARQHDGPVGQVGQQPRRDAAVVLDQVALGVALLGPEHLVEVGQADAAFRFRRSRRWRRLFGSIEIGCDAFLRRKVVTHFEEHGMPQVAGVGPLFVTDFADQLRPGPVVIVAAREFSLARRFGLV